MHFLEILDNLEIVEFLKNPQTLEEKGDSDHFLELLENLEILEISPVKRLFRNDPLFPGPQIPTAIAIRYRDSNFKRKSSSLNFVKEFRRFLS